MHSDTTAIELRDAVRGTLAEQMAEFERQHGKVETTPIIVSGTSGAFNKRRAELEAKSRLRGVKASRLVAKPRSRHAP